MAKQRTSRLSKSFYLTFFLLFGFFLSFFIIFAVYTYFNSQRALQNEFLSYSKQQTLTVASTVDTNIRDARIIMAGLYNNSYVRSFFTSADPNSLIPSNTDVVAEQLHSFANSFHYLHSIHLYSPASGQILSSLRSANLSLDSFTDIEWRAYMEEAADKSYHLLLRENNNSSMVTLLKTHNTRYGLAAIVINIDLSLVAPLSSYTNVSTEKVYVISDDSEILYRYGQRQYSESIDIIPALGDFDVSLAEKQCFVNGDEPYIYTQQHSSDYPWSYVMVTDITDYTTRLSSTRSFLLTVLIFSFCLALIMIFIIVFRSTKPISAIIHLLDSPEDFLSHDMQNLHDPENQEIIQKIMTYIQTSATLSSELEQQLVRLNDARMLALQTQINPHFLMNTLNMIYTLVAETLGYDHQVPRMTVALSRLLRYALDTTDSVPLRIEADHAQQFSQLINQRYQNTIRFTFQIHPDTEEIILPKLVIQPLIENAVFHGLSLKRKADDTAQQEKPHLIKERIICISTVLEDDFCLLTVTDNGLGISPEKLSELTARISDYENTPSTSIGLHNVMLRMHLLYGDQFTFRIDSATAESDSQILKQGTTVTLRFPAMH